MQKPLNQIKKEKRDSIFSQRPLEPVSVSFHQHWETPISGKFTLLDWYWLLEEESGDLNVSNLSQNYCSNLVQNCVDAYVRKNVIPYTVYKFQEEILQLFLLIKTYPETLKPELEDSILDETEPLPCEIDTYTYGWPKPIYDPVFKISKIIPKTHVETQQDGDISLTQEKSNIPLGESHSATVSSSGGGQRVIKKKLTSVTHLRKRKTTTATNRPSVTSRRKSVKSILPFEGETTAKKKTSRRLTTVTLVPPKISSSRVSAVKPPEKIESVFSIMDKVKKHTPPKPVKQFSGKSMPGPELQTTIPTSITFDRLETSNFPLTRTKTGFMIKDVEVVKEVGKLPSVKRSSVGPKRGGDGMTVKSSAGTASLLPGNIFTMPPVAETMTNLGGGVLIRTDVNYKIAESHTSMVDGNEAEEKPLLKPISRGKIEPQFLVSQLIDRSVPSLSRISKH